MKFRYIKNIINAQDKCVDMFLYSEIGGDSGISGQQFADELNYLANATDTEVVNVRINSPGGVVFDGLSILAAITAINKSGKMEVNTHNDGICASIAGVILLAGKNRSSIPHGRVMIHPARMLDNEGVAIPNDSLNADDKGYIDTMTNMASEIFTSATKKNAKFFNDLMATGNDAWYDAQQAFKMGIINVDPDAPDEDLDLVDIDISELSAIATNPKALYQKFVNLTNIKKHDMKKIFMELGAANTEASKQTEDAAVELIKKQNEKIAALETENGTLKTQLAGAPKPEDLEAAKEAGAEVAVQSAIDAGKLDASKKAEMKVVYKTSPSAFNTMVGAMNTPAMRITDKIKPEDKDKLVAKIGGRKLREIERKDEKLAMEIRMASPELYKEMYKDAYGVEYKG